MILFISVLNHFLAIFAEKSQLLSLFVWFSNDWMHFQLNTILPNEVICSLMPLIHQWGSWDLYGFFMNYVRNMEGLNA